MGRSGPGRPTYKRHRATRRRHIHIHVDDHNHPVHNASASEITGNVTTSAPSGVSVLAAAFTFNLDNAGGRRQL